MKHCKEYWDIVALDKSPKSKMYDRDLKRRELHDWRWVWRQKFLTLIRQQSEWIRHDGMYMRQAGWR